MLNQIIKSYKKIKVFLIFFFNKMLDWVSGKLIKLERVPQQAIISSAFVLTVDNKGYQNVIATLYQQFIILENKKSTLKVMISFKSGVLFEIIRYRDENGVLGAARSIKFIYNQNWMQLKNSSIPKQMEVWIMKLNSKLNQNGFHDHYQAIKRIGKGAFASVYLVKNKHNNQQVAVKAFSKEALIEEPKGLQSLQKEINIMRSMSHPNLMKLHQVFQTPNSYYLCVQLLKGGSLADKIKKVRRFSQITIKNIMKSLLQGLQSMHEKNIMHRDLKPDNILFRDQNSDECVIADFGLGESSQSKEFLFSRCGTPGYVAPEVANLKNPNEKYSCACDLFSLGVIFHMMALKRAPFEGRSYNQILIKNRNCQIDFTQPQYKRLPESWLDLMKRLLEKDPKMRITAAEALEHEFFEEEVVFKQFVQRRRKESRDKIKSSEKCQTFTTCNSNILLSGNKEKRKLISLAQDSCIKFKMHETLMNGKIQLESKQNLNEFSSPLIVKKTIVTQGQSRFRIRA